MKEMNYKDMDFWDCQIKILEDKIKEIDRQAKEQQRIDRATIELDFGSNNADKK